MYSAVLFTLNYFAAAVEVFVHQLTDATDFPVTRLVVWFLRLWGLAPSLRPILPNSKP